jgi:GntR family transcriptional regulator
MLITLERNSGIPVFRQICEQVRFQVAAGILASGAEAPSTRDLAAQLGINPMTVSKAYALLEQEGVLERRPGLSLVVRGKSERAEHGSRLEELQRLLRPAAVAAHQLGIPPSEALELFRKALRAPGDNP